MKDKVKRNFSKAAEKYDSLATLQEKAGRELLRLYEMAGAPKPVLDLGAGTGRLLSGRGVVSLDIAPGMAKLCRKRGNLSVCGNGELLPFRDGSFKGVFTNFSLQWTEIDRVTEEVFRVLEKGGLFFLSVPVEGSLETLFKAWRRASGRAPGFRFPKEEEIFRKTAELFEVLTFRRLFLRERFNSPREALKRITGIGAKNPFVRAGFREAKRFREIYGEDPVVEYRVFLAVARKA